MRPVDLVTVAVEDPQHAIVMPLLDAAKLVYLFGTLTDVSAAVGVQVRRRRLVDTGETADADALATSSSTQPVPMVVHRRSRPRRCPPTRRDGGWRHTAPGHNIARSCARMADAILDAASAGPDFGHAVRVHRLLDLVRRSLKNDGRLR